MRVEDRLLLFEKRKLEKLEKARTEKYRDLLRPTHTNKENKARNEGSVFQRLYSSSKKSSQPCLPSNMMSSEISLHKVIKPMPEYLNLRKSTMQEYQMSSKHSLSRKEIQSVVLHNYMESSKNHQNNFSSSSSTNLHRSPCKAPRSSQVVHSKGILDQCMEAYFKKYSEKQY